MQWKIQIIPVDWRITCDIRCCIDVKLMTAVAASNSGVLGACTAASQAVTHRVHTSTEPEPESSAQTTEISEMYSSAT